MGMNDDDQHKYKKDKDGFKIDTTDPIQDIMSEDELNDAHKKIQELLDQQDTK